MKTYTCLRADSYTIGEFSIIPVQSGHIEAIRQWRNSQLNVLRQVAPISQQQQQSYYENLIWPSMSEAAPANILVSFLNCGTPIGYGGLVHIAWEDLRAEVSFLLDPERAANASTYSKDFSCFLNLIKRLAFDDLGLHRLFTETYDVRPVHIATLEETGFAREGVMRDHVRIDGQPVNSIIHGCLNN